MSVVLAAYLGDTAWTYGLSMSEPYRL